MTTPRSTRRWRALAADKGEQKGGGGGGGDRGGRGDPDKGRRDDDDEDGGWRVEDYQIIAGFKTMDTFRDAPPRHVRHHGS